MPFDNNVMRATLTGAQVEKLTKLLVGRRTHGGATSLAGLKTLHDDNGNLVVLTSKGVRLDAARRYVMALSDFIVQGGEGADSIFRDVAEADTVDTHITMLDTLVALLQKLYPGPQDPPFKKLPNRPRLDLGLP